MPSICYFYFSAFSSFIDEIVLKHAQRSDKVYRLGSVNCATYMAAVWKNVLLHLYCGAPSQGQLLCNKMHVKRLKYFFCQEDFLCAAEFYVRFMRLSLLLQITARPNSYPQAYAASVFWKTSIIDVLFYVATYVYQLLIFIVGTTSLIQQTSTTLDIHVWIFLRLLLLVHDTDSSLMLFMEHISYLIDCELSVSMCWS